MLLLKRKRRAQNELTTRRRAVVLLMFYVLCVLSVAVISTHARTLTQIRAFSVCVFVCGCVCGCVCGGLCVCVPLSFLFLSLFLLLSHIYHFTFSHEQYMHTSPGNFSIFLLSSRFPFFRFSSNRPLSPQGITSRERHFFADDFFSMMEGSAEPSALSMSSASRSSLSSSYRHPRPALIRESADHSRSRSRSRSPQRAGSDGHGVTVGGGHLLGHAGERTAANLRLRSPLRSPSPNREHLVRRLRMTRLAPSSPSSLSLSSSLSRGDAADDAADAAPATAATSSSSSSSTTTTTATLAVPPGSRVRTALFTASPRLFTSAAVSIAPSPNTPQVGLALPRITLDDDNDDSNNNNNDDGEFNSSVHRDIGRGDGDSPSSVAVATSAAMASPAPDVFSPAPARFRVSLNEATRNEIASSATAAAAAAATASEAFELCRLARSRQQPQPRARLSAVGNTPLRSTNQSSSSPLSLLPGVRVTVSDAPTAAEAARSSDFDSIEQRRLALARHHQGSQPRARLHAVGSTPAQARHLLALPSATSWASPPATERQRRRARRSMPFLRHNAVADISNVGEETDEVERGVEGFEVGELVRAETNSREGAENHSMDVALMAQQDGLFVNNLSFF